MRYNIESVTIRNWYVNLKSRSIREGVRHRLIDIENKD